MAAYDHDYLFKILLIGDSGVGKVRHVKCGRRVHGVASVRVHGVSQVRLHGMVRVWVVPSVGARNAACK
jgi:hypothetical protein